MLLSIVVPLYNELEVLPSLLAAIRRTMAGSRDSYEIILVDDGSLDGTVEALKEAAASDSHVKALFFSRNFGHQAAITAGLDFASGDAAAVIDADLQDPPELLPEMVALLEQGYDIVSAQRITRSGDGFVKRYTASLFYWIIRKLVDSRIQPEVGDFRVFSRRALTALQQLREQHRFMRGMVAWLGLKEAILPYHRNPRLAGTTKYSMWKMLRFAWTAISSFSALPLRLSVFFGFFVAACGFGFAAYSVFAALVLKATVPGWTSLVVLNIIFSGATLIAIGLVGEYVSRIYEEAKGRPLYVVADRANIQIMGPQVAKAVVLPSICDEPDKTYERAARKANRL
ncbi:MAG TPA: glycosyltransferase family 2 protein [Terriglobia bacterium]|nr:glycosyltransferase family 2 protein [Terriglobia bacterium]